MKKLYKFLMLPLLVLCAGTVFAACSPTSDLTPSSTPAQSQSESPSTGQSQSQTQGLGVTYTLTYSSGIGGTINGTLFQTGNEGDLGTTVEAIPDEGYSFIKWSDGYIFASRSDAFTLAEKTYTAQFGRLYNIKFQDAKGELIKELQKLEGTSFTHGESIINEPYPINQSGIYWDKAWIDQSGNIFNEYSLPKVTADVTYRRYINFTNDEILFDEPYTDEVFDRYGDYVRLTLENKTVLQLFIEYNKDSMLSCGFYRFDRELCTLTVVPGRSIYNLDAGEYFLRYYLSQQTGSIVTFTLKTIADTLTATSSINIDEVVTTAAVDNYYNFSIAADIENISFYVKDVDVTVISAVDYFEIVYQEGKQQVQDSIDIKLAELVRGDYYLYVRGVGEFSVLPARNGTSETAANVTLGEKTPYNLVLGEFWFKLELPKATNIRFIVNILGTGTVDPTLTFYDENLQQFDYPYGGPHGVPRYGSETLSITNFGAGINYIKCKSHGGGTIFQIELHDMEEIVTLVSLDETHEFQTDDFSKTWFRFNIDEDITIRPEFRNIEYNMIREDDYTNREFVLVQIFSVDDNGLSFLFIDYGLQMVDSYVLDDVSLEQGEYYMQITRSNYSSSNLGIENGNFILNSVV